MRNESVRYVFKNMFFNEQFLQQHPYRRRLSWASPVKSSFEPITNLSVAIQSQFRNPITYKRIEFRKNIRGRRLY
jgi:hypothetical protein